MKKVLLVLFVLLLMFGGYLLFDSIGNKGIPKLDVESDKVAINKLYIYGNHLNMTGDISNITGYNLDLVLYNGEFINYGINDLRNTFVLSNEVNRGIKLESIPEGKYYVFLRNTAKTENDEDVYKYYALDNKSGYDETIYYTFSNKNNKIVINSDEEYGTLLIDVTENKDDGIYDVVIDLGHGGYDTGASKGNYKESEMTIEVALKVMEELEKYGIKAKITRENGQLANDEKLNDYGLHGRCVLPHEVNAKYVLSIHMNSNAYSSVHGLEVYTADNIDYSFAKDLAKNITDTVGISYSNNKVNRVYTGVYTRTFTERDVASSIEEYKKKGLVPYDFSTDSNYYFMIREPGSIVTGAYVDDRNPEKDGNPYVKSNVGVESYILELGFLTNPSDLEILANNADTYAKAIASSFKKVYDGEY